jgi:hypothetical protein
MTPATAKQKKMSALELSQKTIALMVKFHKFGNHRKVSTAEVQVEADKEWISVSKKLVECPELEQILSLDGRVRKFLDSRALPSLLAKGIYLLPLPYVEEVNAKLQEFSAEREKLVQAFGKVYVAVVREAQKKLDAIFDEGDYPGVEEMERQFYLKFQYISFNTPVALEQINAELYEQEKAKAEIVWKDANETIQQLLRANLGDLVSHLVNKLTPDEGGKKKKFHDSALTNLDEFLKTFDVRNVTNDADLKKLVDKAKKLVAGTSPELLRNEEENRAFVTAGFEEIKKAIAPMIVERPKRSISFED